MNIPQEYVDVAKTPQEAIELFNQSLVNAGLKQRSEAEGGAHRISNLYALILVKEVVDQDTHRLLAAQEISKLVSKYLKVSQHKPLMVYCQNSDQEPQE